MNHTNSTRPNFRKGERLQKPALFLSVTFLEPRVSSYMVGN